MNFVKIIISISLLFLFESVFAESTENFSGSRSVKVHYNTAKKKAKKRIRRRIKRKRITTRNSRKKRSRKTAKRTKKSSKKTKSTKIIHGKTGSKGKVQVYISKGRQHMTVKVNGKLYMSTPIGTGRAGHRTPSGSFKPGEMKRSRLSRYATRKVGRKVYLKNAVQVIDGIFLHNASIGAMNYIRKRVPRSAGCVRVPPSAMSKLYSLIAKNKRNTRIIIN